jgi:DNA-binding CsgD family transcriptional regulator
MRRCPKMFFNFNSAMEERVICDFLEKGDKYPAMSERLGVCEPTIATIFYKFRKRHGIPNNWQLLVQYWKAKTSAEIPIIGYLTKTQKLVFKEVVHTGDPISLIALRLGFKESNVKKHLCNILKETGIGSTQKLIVTYWRDLW